MRKVALGLIAGLVLAAGAAHAVPEVKVEKTFPKNGHIHGYMVNEAGVGVAGWVSLETTGGARLRSIYADGFRRGRFDLDNLQPGRYKLRAEAIHPNFETSADLVPGVEVEVEVTDKHVSRPHLMLHTAP
jgi:hypothetical protein